jgi:hypothetical protein
MEVDLSVQEMYDKILKLNSKGKTVPLMTEH